MQTDRQPADAPAPATDSVLGFTVPGRNARGRLVRLGATLDKILKAHAYPEPLGRLLAEALVLTALVGSTLRADEGQMTMQAQSKGGPVDLLVCDYRGGELRGYLRFDPSRIDEVGPQASLPTIFGEGYLAITLDQTVTQERYQGIVPLEGDTLSHAVENYFDSSEQIPTLLRVGVARVPEGRWRAGGLLVQHLPAGEVGRARLHVERMHPDWEHVAALAGSTSEGELVDEALPLDALLWRLFHEEETRVTPPVALGNGCRCSADYIKGVLSRFSEEELADMREADGKVKVDCAFCATIFAIDV
ncbi:Hsp33 family molecular chaperone HslO [Sphingoaurantiacus capsulatus]|uniref:Hsp33 family molecular chaperone HslO n=1 Tax=Sphingoaurantiacus capsulatus TaxID=1771310 RepID=A0ABV7XC79_9SPHN